MTGTQWASAASEHKPDDGRGGAHAPRSVGKPEQPLSSQHTEVPALDALFDAGPFVLLETRKPDAENTRSLLFQRPVEALSLERADGVGAFFSRIEAALEEGLWVAGYFSYELGYLLEEKLAPLLDAKRGHTPLAWVGLFGSPCAADVREQQAERLWEVGESGPGGGRGPRIADLGLNTTRQQYCKAIRRIKSYIESGDTYQVNFTVKRRLSFEGGPGELYLALRDRQRVAYAALLNDGERSVISLSPELFFRKDGLCLQSKPMKGTVRRGRTTQEDQNLARWLGNDPKNRAENVMIVDLIRNDLGRLAPPGGVSVPRLFEVERYETLFQMTSTVEARLDREVRWREVFGALFPCGSVTGAPKIRTMEIIAELEEEPRGVYTGAIGYISPEGRACFNVAIRTIIADRDNHAEMGIGGGITYDSDETSEYEECLLKGRFLTQEAPAFSLIETMRLEGGEISVLDRHLARLSDSAAHLGFACPAQEIERALLGLAEQKPDQRLRVRLVLERGGAFEVEQTPLGEESRAPLSFRVSETRVDSMDPFLYHKTTHRPLYNAQRERALAEGLDEVVFLNERDELTEGTITNLFVERGGKLYTPPLYSGLLPGTLRQELLDEGRCQEQVLSVDDLRRADGIFLGNSVRGLVEGVERT